MHHRFNVARKQPRNGIGIANVTFVHRERIVVEALREVLAFDRRVVKVVEVVEPDDRAVLFK